MKLTISFDPDEDEIGTVLTSVASAFQTTLDQLIPSQQSTDDPGRAATVGPWTELKARKVLDLLAPTALRAAALMTISGFVTLSQAKDYLGTDSLRGIFSSCAAAVRKTRGLPDDEKVFAKVRDPEWGYAMPSDKRQLFREAFQSVGKLEMLADARAYAKQEGIIH